MDNKISTVSIIIPTFNRVHTLKRNLLCLEKQTYPSDLIEVVVVDDWSTDTTWQMLERYESKLKLKKTRNPKGEAKKYGYISCQQTGLELAENELLIFLDDDLLAEEHLVEEHVKTHNFWLSKGEEIICRGWRTEQFTIDELAKYDIEEDKLYNSKLRYYIDNSDDIHPGMCIGNNFSILRKNALAVGGFGIDEYRYGQDGRIPYKCKSILKMRIVANVKAFGSHIPLPEDADGVRAGKKYEVIERTPINRIKCLLELMERYAMYGNHNKISPLIKEAEQVIDTYFAGNHNLKNNVLAVASLLMKK